MQLTALSAVKHRIRVGEPLPFNVRNADRTLLLARGQPVGSSAQLEALFDRGALVDIAELQSTAEKLHLLPREQLPQRWRQCMDNVARTLEQAPHDDFRSALDDAATPVLALIERDPDLAIFQVLRNEGGAGTAYGVRRSLNSAITAFLVAQRLAWHPEAVERVFKVALTMNIAMLELQGALARQRGAPTPDQLQRLRMHPLMGMEQLQQAGVHDADWLQAVATHHEHEDGSGYPHGSRDISELASLARRCDAYTAKLSARSFRDALSADVAGRQMFMQDPGHPMTAALVKEFGVYPPGCFVRLASGATAVVVERGEMVTTPVVACLTHADGMPLPQPERRETSQPQHRIVGVVGERSINVRITAEKLMALTMR
ncbi:HD-GYP domain-containing protein [Rubrivivax sp. RP6-9]|uniref:HD-GYP domain-containing protein n=1 Tax=Rubrivivax sp. RP6-9 TaxID=3415750 RepID=UPI003CC645FE